MMESTPVFMAPSALTTTVTTVEVPLSVTVKLVSQNLINLLDYTVSIT